MYKTLNEYSLINDFEIDDSFLVEKVVSKNGKEYFRNIGGQILCKCSDVNPLIISNLTDGEFLANKYLPFRNKMVKVAGHERNSSRVWVIDGKDYFPVQKAVLRKYLYDGICDYFDRLDE